MVVPIGVGDIGLEAKRRVGEGRASLRGIATRGVLPRLRGRGEQRNIRGIPIAISALCHYLHLFPFMSVA